jgi:hypothetical protein
MKVRKAYRLPCGHTGKIKAIFEGTVVVEGPIRESFCVHCYPRDSRRHPSIYLISLHESKDPILAK